MQHGDNRYRQFMLCRRESSLVDRSVWVRYGIGDFRSFNLKCASRLAITLAEVDEQILAV